MRSLIGVGQPARPRPAVADMAVALFLGLLALAIRSFRVAETLVWLDEIYGFLLVRQGLGPIFANSLSDPHPPGWYLLLWLTTGLGQIRGEWALRWPVILAGAATVPLVYALARRYTGQAWAALAAALLAVSPFHIYLSQEARQAALTACLAAVAALGMERVLRREGERVGWAILIGAALAGLYTNYFYALAVGGQLLGLLLLRRWRAALAYGLALAVLSAPLAYLFFRVIPAFEQARHTSTYPPHLFLLALVGGEPLRYGWGWWHWALGLLLLPLAALGTLAVRRDRALWYHIAQVLAPFVGFWAVAIPLFHISLPPNQIKHFLLVLPSLFVLVALGLERVASLRPALLGRGLVAGLCAAAVAASLLSASHPWSQGKSPEGDAALALGAVVAPGDAVVVLPYSPSYALSFYRPELQQYVAPAVGPAGWELAALPREAMAPPHNVARVPAGQLMAAPRVWVISDNRHPEAVLDHFRARCAGDLAGVYGPFELLRLEGCVP